MTTSQKYLVMRVYGDSTMCVGEFDTLELAENFINSESKWDVSGVTYDICESF